MWQQGMGVGIFIIKHHRIFHCSQSEPRVGPTRREALDTTTAARKAERRRVSQVDEMGTDEPHCQGEGRRSQKEIVARRSEGRGERS